MKNEDKTYKCKPQLHQRLRYPLFCLFCSHFFIFPFPVLIICSPFPVLLQHFSFRIKEISTLKLSGPPCLKTCRHGCPKKFLTKRCSSKGGIYLFIYLFFGGRGGGGEWGCWGHKIEVRLFFGEEMTELCL